MFADVVELLLNKKAGINDEREKKIAAAIEEINREFESRENKIDALLQMAGYVAPIAEPIKETQPAEQVVEQVPQQTIQFN